MTMEQFHYPLDDGREIVLPRFKNVPFGVMRKLRHESEVEQLFALAEPVAAPEALDIIDTLGMEDIDALYAAWQKDSEVTAGESSASSTS